MIASVNILVISSLPTIFNNLDSDITTGKFKRLNWYFSSSKQKAGKCLNEDVQKFSNRPHKKTKKKIFFKQLPCTTPYSMLYEISFLIVGVFQKILGLTGQHFDQTVNAL